MIRPVANRVNIIRPSLHFRGWWAHALVSVLAFLAVSAVGAPSRIAPVELEFFEKRIRPTLVDSCYECHSNEGKKLKAGLAVDHRAGLLEGGDSGPAVVLGHPEQSRLGDGGIVRRSEPESETPGGHE